MNSGSTVRISRMLGHAHAGLGVSEEISGRIQKRSCARGSACGYIAMNLLLCVTEIIFAACCYHVYIWVHH